MRLLLLALVCCVSLRAQLELFLIGTPGVETPAGVRLDCGTVTTGDFGDLRLRIRNVSSKPETLKNVVVTGTGFRVTNLVPLPYVVPAGSNVDFRIRFEPTGLGSYSGTFTFNGKSWFVSGRSPEAATLLVDIDGVLTPVTSSIPIDFGRIERGTKSVRRLVLRNTTGARLVVKSISVDTGYFSGPMGLSLPAELAAGADMALEMAYTPLRSGVHQAKLDVDGRMIVLEGMAVEPPFPEAHLKWLSSTVTSGEQAKIGIALSAASRAVGSGVLTMTFTPARGLSDDAAVQFVASSSRTLRIPVREGDTELSVNGLKEIFLQTGTTAGRLSLEFELDGRKLSLAAELAPGGVKTETITTARTSSGVQLRLAGFDNTRTVSGIGFYFYDRAGALIGGAPVTTDAASVFRQYFGGSTLGGVFSMTVQFPVQGDTARIAGVEIEFANSAGKSKTSRASF